ncbi:MAG: pantoate--beta-alanine ligase [Candidatus Hydrogenedentes bacterium]|nr:pantoate--beta-alanine ligase [Candidatus Hydrogenedentota bacterium]
MRVFEDPGAMREWSLEQRCQGRTIGFVPTMGALHEGHASLMRAASGQNDTAVASIFVNPTQFAPHEDFDKYPRTWDDDVALAEKGGVQAIYHPSAKAMYPDDAATRVHVSRITERLCGASRPHFFEGVATVVAKLFNAVYPHRAYFGQKDAQQTVVIRRMARDLDMPVEIVEMPIVREADRLALSSRNRYLSSDERARALALPRALDHARLMLESGERKAAAITSAVESALDGLKIDYVELVDAEDITPLDEVRGKVLLAAAVWCGQTRLIDNIKYEVPDS